MASETATAPSPVELTDDFEGVERAHVHRGSGSLSATRDAPVGGDAALLAALAPYRGPKGNLSFPLAEAMPYELIRRVARQRVQENAARGASRKTR